MLRRNSFRLALLLAAAGWQGALAQSVPERDPSRGELLYTTHCIACHTTQVHWRDRKAARDWPTLQATVNRWQRTAALGWNEEDVTEVSRFLNARYYRHPVGNAP